MKAKTSVAICVEMIVYLVLYRCMTTPLNSTPSNLCKPIHDINCSTFICPFKSEKCGKEGKNYKNLNNSRTKRAF